MKFLETVKFYKLNDDVTITVQFGENYYRCKARLDVLLKFKDVEQGAEILCQFGLAYVRGQGLVLQLIDVVSDEHENIIK